MTAMCVVKFRSLLLVLLLSTVIENVVPQIVLKIPHLCDDETKEVCHTKKKYIFVTMFKANFFKAHQYCQITDLELLTIDSKEEEVAFLNLLNSKDFEFKSSKDFWISGTDLGNEGNFFFLSNGKSVGDLTWARDEPNNAKRPDSNETENCMAYTMTENLKFFRLFDRFCSMKFHFICQEPQRKRYHLSQRHFI